MYYIFLLWLLKMELNVLFTYSCMKMITSHSPFLPTQIYEDKNLCSISSIMSLSFQTSSGVPILYVLSCFNSEPMEVFSGALLPCLKKMYLALTISKGCQLKRSQLNFFMRHEILKFIITKNLSSLQYRELQIIVDFYAESSLWSINNYPVNKNTESYFFKFNLRVVSMVNLESKDNFVFQVLTYYILDMSGTKFFTRQIACKLFNISKTGCPKWDV